MNLFKIAKKMLFKNKFLLGATCIYGVGAAAFLAYTYVLYLTNSSGLFSPDTGILNILRQCTLSFVFFAFLSYEYCFTARKSSADEWLLAGGNSYSKVFKNQLSVLFGVAFLFFIVVSFVCVLLNTLLAGQFIGEYSVHILMVLFVYQLLMPCVAILFGGFCALLLPRLAAYLMLVLFVFFSSPFFSTVLNGLPRGAAYKLGYRFYDFIHIFPVNTDYGFNSNYGYSLLPCQIDAMLFWGLLFLSGILLYFARKNRGRVLKIAACVCVVGCAAFFTLYLQPSSRMDRSSNPSSGTLVDYNYYVEQGHYKDGREEEANFEITNYNLTFDIYRQLKGQAELTLSKTDLPEYRFTLYHAYHIKWVENQNHERLPFTQEGDYVAVTAGSQPTERITISYTGYSTRFSSNVQFTWLPASFAYYPRAGYHPVYSYDDQSTSHGVMNRLIAQEETPFQIKVNCLRRVYSNLPETGRNTFVGTADGVSFISGFLKETESQGVTMVYPYLIYDAAWMKQELQNAKENDYIPNAITRILCNPNLDDAVLPEYNAYYSNHATLNVIPFDKDSYLSTSASIQKKPLIDLLYFYEFQNSFYTQRVAEEKGIDRKDTSTYYAQFDAILSSLGENETLNLCNDYLLNQKDVRSVQEFLHSLSVEADANP